jgi:hypothetical protein
MRLLGMGDSHLRLNRRSGRVAAEPVSTRRYPIPMYDAGLLVLTLSYVAGCDYYSQVRLLRLDATVSCPRC